MTRGGGSSQRPLFVKGGCQFSDGFASRFGIDSESTRVLVSALGLEQDGGRSLLAQVSEGGVAELVQRPPAGGLFVDGGSPLVGQSSPARVWAFVPPGGDDVGSPMGQEHRSSASSRQVSGEKASGARGPEHVFFVAAFADDDRSFAGKVQIFNVESQDFPCSGGGFVEHPPQGFFSQVDVSS